MGGASASSDVDERGIAHRGWLPGVTTAEAGFYPGYCQVTGTGFDGG